MIYQKIIKCIMKYVSLVNFSSILVGSQQIIETFETYLLLLTIKIIYLLNKNNNCKWKIL